MKYVLVTGANGGMGKATIEKLVNSGYYVFAIDKDLPASGNNIMPMAVDITSLSELEKAKEEIKKITNDLYAIIHFAGIYLLNSLVEIEEKEYEKIFRVNVFGPFLINKLFIDMMENGSRIIMTTSELALRSPLPFTGLYGITKTTLDKYSYSLKMELQLLDIYVSVIRPGAVKTNMLNVSTTALDKFCESTKLYNISSKNFRNIVNSVEAKYIMPEKIASKALGILESKTPKFSYNVNHNMFLKLLDLLPKKWRFRIIKKILTK